MREDGTPYYIGKGKGDRIHHPNHSVNLPPQNRRIFIKENLSENEAFSEEIKLISFYGRKDLGTGILRNKSEGGRGGDLSHYIDYEKREEKRLATVTSKEYEPILKKSHEKRVQTITSSDYADNALIISKSKSNKMKGYYEDEDWAEDRRTKVIEGMKTPEFIASHYYTCEHCGIYVNKGNYIRWHGKNCKKASIKNKKDMK